MPDLTLKEFEGIKKRDLHQSLEEEFRKMAFPRAPVKSRKSVFTRPLSDVFRPLLRILPRLHLT
jgi:hypothetical protein